MYCVPTATPEVCRVKLATTPSFTDAAPAVSVKVGVGAGPPVEVSLTMTEAVWPATVSVRASTPSVTPSLTRITGISAVPSSPIVAVPVSRWPCTSTAETPPIV